MNNSLLAEDVMNYRNSARTQQLIRTWLLSGFALFTSGAMHCARAQQQPTPLGCFKDQGDPQGTSGRDLSGYMFIAPAPLAKWPGPSRPGIVRKPPGGMEIVVPPAPGPGMTGAMCTSECAKRGFTFAATQYSNYCFCGNQYGRSGASRRGLRFD
jgi:hypothetical protein